MMLNNNTKSEAESTASLFFIFPPHPLFYIIHYYIIYIGKNPACADLFAAVFAAYFVAAKLT